MTAEHSLTTVKGRPASVDGVMNVAIEAEPNTPNGGCGNTSVKGPAEQDLPALAYQVTLVLIRGKGPLITKVVDSRLDSLESVWREMENSREKEERVYRLILAEDLPRETAVLLEKVLHGDRRILIDHTANKGHGTQGWEERRVQNPKAEFHINVSEPPTSISLALPYEIIGKAKQPADGGAHLVEYAFANATSDKMDKAMSWMQTRPCSIRTSWLTVPPYDLGIQQFLHVAYRRISIQFLPTTNQESPLCVILMYPPLVRLEAKDLDFKFPADVAYPSNFAEVGLPDDCATSNMGAVDMPPVSASLVHYFAAQLSLGNHTSTSVQTMISRWMINNTQATFRESIIVSVDYWCFVSSMTRERPHEIGEVIEGNRDLLGRFREAITVKLRQLEKTRAELSWTEDLDPDTEIQFRQGWQRLDLSLDPILADVEKLLQKRATDLQRRMTNIQIEESRTAIQQAETVKRLTRLAFIFIPISATCSAFGMNVQELIHGPPPVWISLLVMLGVTITTIICSLETTHNIFWAIACMIELLMPRQSPKASMSPIFAPRRTAGETSTWLPSSFNMRLEGGPLPVQSVRKLGRMLFDLCRIPWVAVERLAWIGAQHKHRRQEKRLAGHVRD